MFLCLDPCTWQDREYDDHSTPLAKINPAKLDTDQWVRVAESMGAGQIVFVAKHTGGFCWWQTHTSDYGVRKTPWRGGISILAVIAWSLTTLISLMLGYCCRRRRKLWSAHFPYPQAQPLARTR